MMADEAPLDPAPGRTGTVVFRLTERQQRRWTWGLAGLALMAWGVAVVRFATERRLDRAGGWVALVIVAALLALAVRWVRNVQPTVTLSPEDLEATWGPRRWRIARADVTDVVVRERGTGRRVVVVHDRGRSVLPVPLTGGSLVGPGPDPRLDEKVELVRRWWRDEQQP
jgi:hypothetical protein